MARSSSESALNGTSVRTPIARQTSVISDHISVFHGTTAPSSIESDSSGTRVARSTVRTMPVPPQVEQAPWLLKASASAPGGKKRTPHAGQVSARPAATSSVGAR